MVEILPDSGKLLFTSTIGNYSSSGDDHWIRTCWNLLLLSLLEGHAEEERTGRKLKLSEPPRELLATCVEIYKGATVHASTRHHRPDI